MNQNSKDQRTALSQMMLQVALRDVKPGGKASGDCEIIRDGIKQFPSDQVVATVNLSVVLGDGGFTIVGGVAGPIMAVRSLLVMLESHIDQEDPMEFKPSGGHFTEQMMEAIMGGLMEAGNSEPDAPCDQDPKQSEVDAHLAETFGDIKSPDVGAGTTEIEDEELSPTSCEDNK